MPKFRASISKSLPSGTVNPVLYDNMEYNHDIEYHNGVVIIMQPGSYKFTATIRGANGNSASQCIGLFIAVDNRDKVYGNRL